MEGAIKEVMKITNQMGLENSLPNRKNIGDYWKMGKDMDLEKYILWSLKNGKKEYGIKENRRIEINELIYFFKYE